MGRYLTGNIGFGFKVKDYEESQTTDSKKLNSFFTAYNEKEAADYGLEKKPIVINGISFSTDEEGDIKDYYAALKGLSINDSDTNEYFKVAKECPYTLAFSGVEPYYSTYIILKSSCLEFSDGEEQIDVSRLIVSEEEIQTFKDFFEKEFNLEIEPKWYFLATYG